MGRRSGLSSEEVSFDSTTTVFAVARSRGCFLLVLVFLFFFFTCQQQKVVPYHPGCIRMANCRKVVPEIDRESGRSGRGVVSRGI